jgi:hypothetical protein
MIWVLGRILFYLLLIPLLFGVIYTLSHEQWWTSLFFMVLCVIILYKGLLRINIPKNSIVLREGKVVFFIPDKTVRDRFEFASRGQTIVQLPHYGVLDQPYKLEILYPNDKGGLNSCLLLLTLGYVMDLTAWQLLYDNFVRYQEQLSLAVKQQLYKSSTHIASSFPMQKEEDMAEYLKPIVAELNLGLGALGLKIENATCKFAAGPLFVRFVAAEQEVMEKDETT